jgi:small-conductance mechanosensitive channel
MSTAYSVAEILAKLEERIAHHQQQADFHAQQEIHHREQNAVHLAELKKVREHFEAFKTSALPAAELVEQIAPPPQPVKEEVEDDREFIGKRIMASRLVARVAERMADGVTFGSREVAAEINRRYRDKLRRPIDARAVAVTLRRLQAAGRLHLVRPGRSNHQALYTKPPRPAAAKPATPKTPPA